MKPPPPMLPALGSVTASAKAVATAASTALPPLARTAAPASHAGADVHTTSPSFDETPRLAAPLGRDDGGQRDGARDDRKNKPSHGAKLNPITPADGELLSESPTGTGLATAQLRDADLAR